MKNFPPTYRLNVYSVSYENEIKEDKNVNVNYSNYVYFVELSVGVYLDTEAMKNCVSQEPFLQP